MRNERDWIRFLKSRFPSGGAVRTGIGDDAAVLRMPSGPDWLVTTDQMVENVHFRRKVQPPRAVGWKALARSLSDIAAMKGRPRYALVALTLPRRLAPGWTRQFFSGLQALARRHKVQLIGGDFAAGPVISADVHVIGEVQRGRAVLRSGAKPGQTIYVTGTLGRAAAGEMLTRRSRSTREASRILRECIRAHFSPEPRVELSDRLPHGVAAMIDISDGLALDLHRLCEASRVGARLFPDRIPCVNLSAREEKRLKANRLELALYGGEDYELLFTAPKNARIPRRIGNVAVTRIGVTTRTRSVLLVESEGTKRGKQLPRQGWDHFAGR